MKNTIILAVVSILLIAGFLFGAYKLTSTPATPVSFPEVSKINPTDHVKWSPTKKHILVEYSDLQCPACKNFHDYITQDIEKAKNGADITKNITFVYRYFPLQDIHPHANEAAYAAEAAGMQGKFFEYANNLFDTQSKWESLPKATDFFVKMARDLKLDEEKFKKDMSSKEVKDRIEDDYNSGLAAQVSSTPTFYLDGVKIENIRSFEEFHDLLEKAAKETK